VARALRAGALTGQSDPSGKASGAGAIFATTFATVFSAELGDKTQLATLLLSAQSGRPILVFIGSALALVASSLVGVLLGRWLANLISPQKLELLAGLLMLVLGGLLGFQVLQGWGLIAWLAF
jgi:putative Ca2+/H+ antiporter (TMEM165/GDT1 family)